MRVIDSSTGIGPEEPCGRDVAGTISSKLGRWRIQTTIRYEGDLYYVCVGVFSHREPRNEVATQIVKQICFGTVLLLKKGVELP